MPIRNKDGTLFNLQGVNPLMKEQDHWENDDKDWKVHYVDSQEEVVVQDPKKQIPEYLSDNAPVPAIVGVGVIKQTELLYCLPLTYTVEEDPLYGQIKKVPVWGEKFNFEAIRTDYTGLTAVFFATLPSEYRAKLERGSIILVYKERQWWKINGTEDADGGVVIYCIPSELKPAMV